MQSGDLYYLSGQELETLRRVFALFRANVDHALWHDDDELNTLIERIESSSGIGLIVPKTN
jgi:hypothetical protein